MVSQLDEGAQPQIWTAERLRHASYKDLGLPDEIEERFYKHLCSSETCVKSIQMLLNETSVTTRDYSITIDAFDLLYNDSILGHLLLKYPATLLRLLENSVVRAQREMLARIEQQHEDNDNDNATALLVKGDRADGATSRIHARLENLPPYCFKTSIGSMGASDVGQIVQLTGTVVRTGPVQMYESARTYVCAGTSAHKCGHTFVVPADMETRNNALVAPHCCPLKNQDTGERCPGTKVQALEGGSVYTDYQEIKIRDSASRLGVGHIPQSLLIKLQHDLVNKSCQPGDEVVVVGSLLAQWQQETPMEGVECQIGIALSAHSLRVVADKGSSAWKGSSEGNNVGELDKFQKEFEEFWLNPDNVRNPFHARDFITKAVCPKLYGLQIIKLALLITLIGGVSLDAYEEQNDDAAESNTLDLSVAFNNYDEPDEFELAVDDQPVGRADSAAYFGDAASFPASSDKNRGKEQVKTRRRDQSHLLLVGDPGTGKSQVLRFANALCPRSVLTTGVGTTSAGLTCAAVREGNGKEFALEAGALVLADKGVCCIDEFGCIQEKDRTTIHEAMEQQTISVAKAGIVCKLNCRATIIAVMNPRDCLYDNYTSLSANTGLGTPLLSRFDLIFKLVDASDAERDRNVTNCLLQRAVHGEGYDVSVTGDEHGSEVPWSMEKLRAYIAIVKERFQPAMSDEAATLLKRHYEKCRSAQQNTIPVTVRFLESLIRLSQSHARLMFRNVVTLEDAVAVIRTMECSAFAYGGFEGSSDPNDSFYKDPMTVDFSSSSDLDFLCFEYRVLTRYNMLEYLDENRRQEAVLALGQTSAADSSSSDRQGVANARDTSEHCPWAQNASSTAYYGAAATLAGSNRGNDLSPTWSVPPTQEDHYGRIHTQTSQQKRPRL
jgi:DNA helicase MCM9